MDIKDEIVRCRYEAKHFRGLAKIQRENAARAKERSDWIGKLKADERTREYVRTAQGYDSRVKDLRGQI